MKRLVLVRHAKAEQGGYDHDFSRALAESGMDDAKMVAHELRKNQIKPDYILTSSAKRALTTANLFAGELGFPKDNIVERKGLYFDYTTNDFIEMIQEVPDKIDTLFVFGHNPFMHFMAQNLTTLFSGHMPTCSTVVIDFQITSWKAVEARKGEVIHHLYPSMFR